MNNDKDNHSMEHNNIKRFIDLGMKADHAIRNADCTNDSDLQYQWQCVDDVLQFAMNVFGDLTYNKELPLPVYEMSLEAQNEWAMGHDMFAHDKDMSYFGQLFNYPPAFPTNMLPILVYRYCCLLAEFIREDQLGSS